MTLEMTVSPDFASDRIAGWYVFNTWLQRRLHHPIHLELHGSFEALREAISAGRVDLIHANAFDAALLVRDRGFIPVAAPLGLRDEFVIAGVTTGAARVEELRPGARVAMTEDPDARLVGMMLLEPAGLNAANIIEQPAASHVLVAKHLLGGKAEIGVFRKEAFDALSRVVRSGLHVLATSEIGVLRHILLLGPRAHAIREALCSALLAMSGDAQGAGVLDSIGFPGWESQSHEDTEFMIDLIDTLRP